MSARPLVAVMDVTGAPSGQVRERISEPAARARAARRRACTIAIYAALRAPWAARRALPAPPADFC